MINVILIDDEPHVCGICRILLSKLSDVNIIAECYNIEDAYEAISELKPDLILLDIQLKDGTGFDLLEKFNDPLFSVIIITSYDEYAIKAIKAGAIDYILKPIVEDEFYLAIEKLCKKTTLNKLQVESAINNYSGDLSKITLNAHDGIVLLNYEDLMYCKSDGGYTTFYPANDKPILISKVLKHYEAILPDNIFIRCHQSFLVNIKYIRRLSPENQIILLNEEKIPVSIRKAKEIKQRLKY